MQSLRTSPHTVSFTIQTSKYRQKYTSHTLDSIWSLISQFLLFRGHIRLESRLCQLDIEVRGKVLHHSVVADLVNEQPPMTLDSLGITDGSVLVLSRIKELEGEGGKVHGGEVLLLKKRPSLVIPYFKGFYDDIPVQTSEIDICVNGLDSSLSDEIEDLLGMISDLSDVEVEDVDQFVDLFEEVFVPADDSVLPKEQNDGVETDESSDEAKKESDCEAVYETPDPSDDEYEHNEVKTPQVTRLEKYLPTPHTTPTQTRNNSVTEKYKETKSHKEIYRCDICQREQTTFANLKNHKTVLHSPTQLWYRCPMCKSRPYETLWFGNLTVHLKKCHLFVDLDEFYGMREHARANAVERVNPDYN